ncbi:uncharacterized protein ARMOST_07407 [Armillaria ostoyae]|uniref:F-box domain-containing protein n=1 Tax=Armillaria ostoyae TaxID=47428 RepID=A0A284R5Q6_ARMOS|nr:uncharacterized protein ARMOST_07407 [Armillaria ostoyae]
MHPHRLTALRFYKISDDVLISILEHLDPPSLWRACKAFRRVYNIVMEFQVLRYRFELAVLGMKDGAVPYARAPPIVRAQLLLTYKKDWPKLQWTHESQLEIPMPAIAGVSGKFIFQIHDHGVFNTLDLSELPSCRTNRPPSQTRHLKYTFPQIEGLAVDGSQGLIVTSHIFTHNGKVCVSLSFKDIGTNKKHRHAITPSFDVSTTIATRVIGVSTLICGSKVTVGLDFHGGKTLRLLMNWRTLEARWLEDLDIYFIDENHLLGICHDRKTGSYMLNSYRIYDVGKMSIVNQYELPEAWKGYSFFAFSTNTSPRTDNEPSSNALFYAAPEVRMLAITAKIRPEHTACEWLFVRESFVKYSSRKGFLPWSYWSTFCMVKDLRKYGPYIRGPLIAGSRAFFIEVDRVNGGRSRLHTIDFSPFPDSYSKSTQSWTWIGSRASFTPAETSRSITFEGLILRQFSVTEDNLIFFLDDGHTDTMIAKVMTFGAPPIRRAA